ncbi:hypothetical protein ACP4OV_019364 [Aristida adscensionis]
MWWQVQQQAHLRNYGKRNREKEKVLTNWTSAIASSTPPNNSVWLF